MASNLYNLLVGVSAGLCVVLLLYVAITVKKIWNHLNAEEVSTTATPVAVPSASAVAPAPVVIPNRGELVAAISAALAEELGEDVSGIRIHSIRQLTPSAQPVAPSRQSLVAAISAVLAEELGQDVSAIRIHSLKQVA